MRLITDTALAAVTIDSEAEGEPYEAKVGVAEVIRNRMARKFFSDGTVAGTVLRKAQFSAWFQASDADRRNLIRALQVNDANPAVEDCLRAWSAAQMGSENVKDALLFYSEPSQPPNWATDDKFVAQFGKLRFYRS